MTDFLKLWRDDPASWFHLKVKPVRKRYKIVLNLEIEDPDEPFPGGNDFKYLSRLQGVVHVILVMSHSYWGNLVKYTVTLDKIVDKGEVKDE